MTEKQVGFLFKAATSLSNITNVNKHIQLLRSYYLMRCKEITRGYGLPQQQFSTKNRCSFCCLEWTKYSETKVKSHKISKRRKKRIKQKKQYNDLLHKSHLEQICSFCKHSNVTPISKPRSEMKNVLTQHKKVNNPECSRPINNLEKTVIRQPVKMNNTQLCVYSKTKEVFSLKNKDNTLSSTIKNKSKIIKNNKKKKDKFAGLCKQAVLATATLKVEKEKLNKLSLFLKPSS